MTQKLQQAIESLRDFTRDFERASDRYSEAFAQFEELAQEKGIEELRKTAGEDFINSLDLLLDKYENVMTRGSELLPLLKVILR